MNSAEKPSPIFPYIFRLDRTIQTASGPKKLQGLSCRQISRSGTLCCVEFEDGIRKVFSTSAVKRDPKFRDSIVTK